MMESLKLEDMADLTDEEVMAHIADQYAGTVSGFGYGQPTDAEKAELAERLSAYELLIAHECSGYSASSFFLLRQKKTGDFGMIAGSHCSCYGFEGQGEIEPVAVEYLGSDRFGVYIDMYDESNGENERLIIARVAEIAKDTK